MAPRQRRFSQIMVVTEIAVALVLVIGAGLMIRSLLRLHQTELGFQSERVLTVRMVSAPWQADIASAGPRGYSAPGEELATGDLPQVQSTSRRWRASIPARGTTVQTCRSRRAPTGLGRCFHCDA